MRAEETCDLLCLDLPRAEAVRGAIPEIAALQAAADEAKALSDPTRLRLAFALSDGEELCVCDLAWISERPDKLVSHHLRQLRGAGLASSRKEGRMVLYSLTGRGETLLRSIMAGAPEAMLP